MEQVTDVSSLEHEEGPIELETYVLSKIGGGLPRGGWIGLEGILKEPAEAALPRGGWLS